MTERGSTYLYKHTQSCTLWSILAGGAFAFCIYMFFAQQSLLFLLVAFVCLFIGFTFGSLTVKLYEDHLKVSFGYGQIWKTIKYDEIASYGHVRNSPILGWGIRYVFPGWMFSVYGLDAVEIRYKSGGRFRIGTDDPQGFLKIIGKKIPQ